MRSFLQFKWRTILRIQRTYSTAFLKKVPRKEPPKKELYYNDFLTASTPTILNSPCTRPKIKDLLLSPPPNNLHKLMLKNSFPTTELLWTDSLRISFEILQGEATASIIHPRVEELRMADGVRGSPTAEASTERCKYPHQTWVCERPKGKQPKNLWKKLEGKCLRYSWVWWCWVCSYVYIVYSIYHIYSYLLHIEDIKQVVWWSEFLHSKCFQMIICDHCGCPPDLW